MMKKIFKVVLVLTLCACVVSTSTFNTPGQHWIVASDDPKGGTGSG